LPGYSTNQILWGCACTPCTPAACTTDYHRILRTSQNDQTGPVVVKRSKKNHAVIGSQIISIAFVAMQS